MAGALDVRVLPATAMVPDARVANVWPRVVKTEDNVEGRDVKIGRTRGIVGLPATNLLGP